MNLNLGVNAVTSVTTGGSTIIQTFGTSIANNIVPLLTLGAIVVAFIVGRLILRKLSNPVQSQSKHFASRNIASIASYRRSYRKHGFSDQKANAWAYLDAYGMR